MSHLTSVSSYLEAVSVGIRQSVPAELPGRITEIIRVLEDLRRSAELDLMPPPEEPDDY